MLGSLAPVKGIGCASQLRYSSEALPGMNVHDMEGWRVRFVERTEQP